MTAPETPAVTPKELRTATLAMVLARAVRDGELNVADALRVIRHELRGLNVNKKLLIRPRSKAAQEVVERYERDGLPVPKNSSADALHADHVWKLTGAHLAEFKTLDDWLEAMAQFREVVCVTATENYALEQVEKQGIDGPEKYALVGIEWADE